MDITCGYRDHVTIQTILFYKGNRCTKLVCEMIMDVHEVSASQGNANDDDDDSGDYDTYFKEA